MGGEWLWLAAHRGAHHGAQRGDAGTAVAQAERMYPVRFHRATTPTDWAGAIETYILPLGLRRLPGSAGLKIMDARNPPNFRSAAALQREALSVLRSLL